MALPRPKVVLEASIAGLSRLKRIKDSHATCRLHAQQRSIVPTTQVNNTAMMNRLVRKKAQNPLHRSVPLQQTYASNSSHPYRSGRLMMRVYSYHGRDMDLRSLRYRRRIRRAVLDDQNIDWRSLSVFEEDDPASVATLSTATSASEAKDTQELHDNDIDKMSTTTSVSLCNCGSCTKC